MFIKDVKIYMLESLNNFCILVKVTKNLLNRLKQSIVCKTPKKLENHYMYLGLI